MALLPDLPSLLLTTTTQYLLPSFLLITTPKSSPYRYLSLPVLIYLASTFIYPVIGTSPTRCNAVAMLIVAAVQAANLLLLKPLDDGALSREKPRRALFLSDRFWSAFEALSQTRAVGTPRQVRNVPSHPGIFASGEIPRGRFLVRQGAVFVWQYLVCDAFQSYARSSSPELDISPRFEHVNWFVSVDVWIERFITNLVTWFVLSRLLIDAHYRLASIIFVGLGLDEAKNWPPAFGRMGDAHTIRNFWG